jgi:chromosome condensin MukBEF complex kleisin-like MukF subunit
MNTKIFSMTFALLGLLAMPRVYAGIKQSSSMTIATEASGNLRDLEMTAAAVRDEADLLRVDISNTESDSEVHAERLMTLKDEVNRMGREVATLESERDSLAPWEQKAIDKTLPLLRDTAANTQKAIEYMDNNKTYLWNPQYRSYADRIWQDSQQIAKTLGEYRKYAKSHDQEQRLEQTLGMTTGN